MSSSWQGLEGSESAKLRLRTGSGPGSRTGRDRVELDRTCVGLVTASRARRSGRGGAAHASDSRGRALRVRLWLGVFSPCCGHDVAGTGGNALEVEREEWLVVVGGQSG